MHFKPKHNISQMVTKLFLCHNRAFFSMKLKPPYFKKSNIKFAELFWCQVLFSVAHPTLSGGFSLVVRSRVRLSKPTEWTKWMGFWANAPPGHACRSCPTRAGLLSRIRADAISATFDTDLSQRSVSYKREEVDRKGGEPWKRMHNYRQARYGHAAWAQSILQWRSETAPPRVQQPRQRLSHPHVCAAAFPLRGPQASSRPPVWIRREPQICRST